MFVYKARTVFVKNFILKTIKNICSYGDLTSKSDDKELLLKLSQLYVVKWCCTRTTYQ